MGLGRLITSMQLACMVFLYIQKSYDIMELE